MSHEGPQTWGQACLQATAQVLLWHHAQRERARAVVPQDEGAWGRQRQTNATGYTYTLHGPSLPPTFRVFHELFYDARACADGMTTHLLRRAPALGCGLSLRGASMHPQAKSSPSDLVPVSAFLRAQERRSTTPDLQTGALALGAGTRSRPRSGHALSPWERARAPAAAEGAWMTARETSTGGCAVLCDGQIHASTRSTST